MSARVSSAPPNQLALARKTRDQVVSSMMIDAIANPEARALANLLDEKKSRLSGEPRDHRLHLYEVRWARRELEKRNKGEASDLDDLTDAQVKTFEKLEKLFLAPMKDDHLEIARHSVARFGDAQADVFWMPKALEKEDLANLTHSRMKLVALEEVGRPDGKAQQYLAMLTSGRLPEVTVGAEVPLSGNALMKVTAIQNPPLSLCEGALHVPNELKAMTNRYLSGEDTAPATREAGVMLLLGAMLATVQLGQSFEWSNVPAGMAVTAGIIGASTAWAALAAAMGPMNPTTPLRACGIEIGSPKLVKDVDAQLDRESAPVKAS